MTHECVNCNMIQFLCHLIVYCIFVTIFTGTYAVQSIMINETGAMLEVVCAFAPNTEAIGCEVTIVRLLNKEVFGSMRAYRTGNSAVMRFLNVLDDEYRLDVFEIENNGFLVQVLTELFQPSAQQPTSETINSFSSTTSAVFQMTTSSNLISGC